MRFFVVAMLILSASCATKFKIRPISDKGPRIIAPAENKNSAEKEELRSLYEKAHRPTFALINGYYSLPKASPYGSAHIIEGYSYGTYISSTRLEKSDMPFAIKALSGDEALALNKALNSLLDLGIRFHELSMSDAINIATAEKQALKNNKSMIWKEHLSPSVDFLVSLDKSHSKEGLVFVGRVISKEGRLVAFRVMPASSTQALSNLIVKLFEDTLKRL
jgi:hypothetical protein